jgi:hypothetical protein
MKNRAALNPVNLIRILFCLSVLLLLGFKGQAQVKGQAQGRIKNLNQSPLLTYQNGIGVRLGSQSGLSYKHFLHEANALEVLLTTHYDQKGLLGTILYEWHRNAFDAKNLLWFYGGGAHAGTYKYKDYYSVSDDRYKKDGYFPVVGIDVILGLEYKIPSLPLAISADFKPSIHVIGGKTGAVDGALTLRYVFR